MWSPSDPSSQVQGGETPRIMGAVCHVLLESLSISYGGRYKRSPQRDQPRESEYLTTAVDPGC